MNMIPKYHFEVIKTVIKLLLFVLRRCWLQSVTLLLLAFLIFYWFGFLILLLTIVIYFIGVVYKMCDYFLYHPDDPPDARTNIPSPALLRLPYESQFITTNDGVAINVVLIKQEPEAQFKAAPTLIYFHGNAGNIGHRLQNAAELYHSLRCNVLLVEYRGYGLSQGYPTEQGLYLDSEAALKYLLNHPGINKNLIFLFGRSLGGAVAINLAQNELLSTYLAAAVIENTFTSIPEIARSLFSFRFIRKIPDWFYKNQFCSVEKIGSVTIPILFISGLCDELVPPKMMTTLYQLSGSVVKQFHSFEAGTHNFTWRCKDYYSVLYSFMQLVISYKGEGSLQTASQYHYKLGDSELIMKDDDDFTKIEIQIQK